MPFYFHLFKIIPIESRIDLIQEMVVIMYDIDTVLKYVKMPFFKKKKKGEKVISFRLTSTLQLEMGKAAQYQMPSLSPKNYLLFCTQ